MTQALDAQHASPVTGGPNFSASHRLVRLIWGIWWVLLCRWTPPPLHIWRIWSLRLFGAHIHSTARVYGTARIWYPANLTMGRYAVLGRRVNCYAMDKIVIGEFATISQDAELCGGTHDPDDVHDQLITRPIHIGRQAWVAAGAFVGPGVDLGEGAVLGARGVAMTSLDPWHIYAGNPARFIRKRTAFDRSDLIDP